MTAVRALGLDAGPLWADFEAIAADAVLLGEQDQQPLLVVNIGYGLWGLSGSMGCGSVLSRPPVLSRP